MKKCILAFLIASLFANAFAQEVPGRLAIYVYGASDLGINKSLGNKLLAAMVQSGRYAEMENSDAFYEELAKNPGGIAWISQTAEQHGADYVCMVSITEALGVHSIFARIIKTANSQMLKIGSADSPLNTFEDLARVSDELARQLLQDFAPPAVATASTPSMDATLVAEATAAQKQCIITFNINEILFKIKNGFTNQLKDCSSKLAKEMALAAVPFGKKAAAPEPKAFMKQCAVDWVRKEIADEFPSKDKLVGSVDNFVQGILATASAGGTLDPKKLVSTVGGIDIEGLLGDIKRLASGECVIDVLYEPPAAPPVAEPYVPASPEPKESGDTFWGGIVVAAIFATFIALIALTGN
jgi:hypothetical protein